MQDQQNINNPSPVNHKKIHPAIGALLIIIITILIQRLLAGIITVYTIEQYYIYLILIEVLVIGLPALFYYKKFIQTDANNNIFTLFPPWSKIFLTIIAAATGVIFYQYFAMFWVSIFNAMGIDPAMQGMPLPETTIQTILSIIAISLAPAFCEELLCRGVLFQSLNRTITKRAAIILSALIFAALHGSFAVLPVHIALGFLLTLLTEKYQSIHLSIIYHLSHNAFSLFFNQYITGLYNQFTQEELAEISSTQAIISPLETILTLLPILLLFGAIYALICRLLLKGNPITNNNIQKTPKKTMIPTSAKQKYIIYILIAACFLLMLPSYIYSFLPQ